MARRGHHLSDNLAPEKIVRGFFVRGRVSDRRVGLVQDEARRVTGGLKHIEAAISRLPDRCLVIRARGRDEGIDIIRPDVYVDKRYIHGGFPLILLAEFYTRHIHF